MNASIILPAYNEAQNIAEVVSDVLAHAGRFFDDYEVIVVDDGSSDDTSGVLARSVGHARVRVVRHDANRGYGRALRTGFEAARMEWIFFMDSDRQFKFADIERLVPHSKNNDLVIGYRLERSDQALRSVNSRVFNLAIRALFGITVKDLNCAFKLMRSKIVKTHKFKTGGALINAEIMVAARSQGITAVEVGVPHYPRVAGSATGARPRVVLRAMAELIKLRLLTW